MKEPIRKIKLADGSARYRLVVDIGRDDDGHYGALVLVITVVTARTMKGMARVQPGQAPAWPLASDRSVRRGLQCQA